MEQQGLYEREINLGQMIIAVLRKSRMIILSGIIFAILIAGFKFVTAGQTMANQEQVTYKSVTDYIGRAKIFLGSDTDTATAEAVRTYLTGNDVIQNVIGGLNLSEDKVLTYSNIFNMINLQNSTDTVAIITVVGAEEALVQDVTNLLATIGSEKISARFQKEEVMILEPAYTEMRQYNAEVKATVKSNSLLIKQMIKYAVIGFVLGAFLCAGIYLYLFMIDSTIMDESDVNGYLGLPVLGKVPVIQGTRKAVNKGKKRKDKRLIQYTNK